MKKVENKKRKSLNKENLIKSLKLVGGSVAIGAAGLFGYKLGCKVTTRLADIALDRVLLDNPEIRDPFIEAWENTYSVKVK